MVQTRSAAKRQQAEEEIQRLAVLSKPLIRETTFIEVTPSATGQGTHIRWLRPPQRPNEIPEILSSDMMQDPRFVTPVPDTAPLLTTPPKLSRQRRIGNPGIFNTGTTVRFNLFRHEVENIVESAKIHGRDLLTEFEHYALEEGTSYDQTPTDTFGNVVQYHSLVLRSPFPGKHVEESSTPLSLGPHGMHLDISLNDLGSTCNQGSDTGYTAVRLGPHGTHLDIQSQDDFVSSGNQTSLGLSQGGSHTGEVRGLGPCGTILIGQDGQAIIPGY